MKAVAVELTPPQSNDVAEAFVGTIKRDYVRVSPLPDAETVIRLAPKNILTPGRLEWRRGNT
jgi:putative transposase